MSAFDLPWEKFVGFALFTFEEDLIFDKVINTKSSFSSVYHIIDTSLKTREELKKSNEITLINDIFRVDYEVFFNLILAFMFKTDISTDGAKKIIEVVKKKLIERIEEYGSIEKMEPSAQSALVKKLGNLICERAANQIKYDYYRTKKVVKATKGEKEVMTSSVSDAPRRTSTEAAIKPSSSTSARRPSAPVKETQPKSVSQPRLENVEELLAFIGFKDEKSEKEKETKTKTKQELTKQMLEETKKESIKRVLSGVIKGLSPKTGVCFVSKSPTGTLELTTFGMSEKHAKFVLAILSKYPEIVKQTLEQDTEEKTLDAGDGVVILEDTESGILVGITAKREEISTIAKRFKVVKSMIDEFLKTTL